jgi:hypothetical protein
MSCEENTKNTYPLIDIGKKRNSPKGRLVRNDHLVWNGRLTPPSTEVKLVVLTIFVYI